MTQKEFQQRYIYNTATDKLGEGGFGCVFKAYDMHRDRWVALKISKVNRQCESISLRKEVELVAQLPSHSNIAYYEECYTFPSFDGDYDFAILQYYDEGNLLQLLRREVIIRISTEQKIAILTQILEGIAFLHQNAIIHRDLKPQNVLIVKRGSELVPKISDFGISKQLDVNKSLVFSNSIAGAGTIAYASPEQLCNCEIRKNTDLWSFGVIAYQVFTGHLPFSTGKHTFTSEAGRLELFRQIHSGKLPKEIDTLPELWQTLIRSCLIINSAQRIRNTQVAKDILAGTQACRHESAKARRHEGTNGKNINASSVSSKSLKSSKSSISPKSSIKKHLLIAASFTAIVLLSIVGLQTLNSENYNKEIPMTTTVETFIDIDIPMVYVEGGVFVMGCTTEQGDACLDEEKPAHQVTVGSFYIGKYVVTQELWNTVMDNNPSYFKGEDLPVESVNWYDVQEFIQKLNILTGKQYRLPTEAEWEYACRGGIYTAHYKSSGGNTANDVAWYSENSDGTTHPVGTKPPNELGLYDMNGNVYEWCRDWYDVYDSDEQTNPQGPSSGSERVFRGGSWDCTLKCVRVSRRNHHTPDHHASNRGLRLACSSE